PIIVPLTTAEYTSLFNRLLEGELSPEEAEIIVSWLGRKEPDPQAAELILRQLNRSVDEHQIPGSIPQLESKLPVIIGSPRTMPTTLLFPGAGWLRYAVAAAVLVLVALGGFWSLRQSNTEPAGKITSLDQMPDVPPGKEGAVLTLADGTQLILDT